MYLSRKNLKILMFMLIFLSESICVGQIFVPMAFWQCKANGLTSSDLSSLDYNKGTFVNTTLSGNSVVLSVGQSTGTYTSRAIDLFGGCPPLGTWFNFSWITSRPFGKEIPSIDENAVDYSNIVTGLRTNLVAYYKLNETTTGTAPGATDFKDESASAAHGTRTGAPTMGVSGRLLNAVTTSSGNYIQLGTVLGSLGSSDVTQATWIKTLNASAGVVINNRNVNTDRTMSLHIGWWAGAATGNGKAYFSNDGPGCETGAISTTTVTDGNWHHIVGVRRSLSNYEIYVDGVLEATNNIIIGSGCTSSNADSTANWEIGRHGAWATTFAGTLDEVMMWRRALSAGEVQSLFQRGGNRLKFQLRTCTQVACADSPVWQGPDGTAATFFTEINNNSIPLTGLGTVLTTSPTLLFTNFPSAVFGTNRFFQYKITFETDKSTISPDLISTTVNEIP